MGAGRFFVQYFGSWTPQNVKDRVTEVLYGWTLWLKDEAKIQEAYSMLKKQGLEASRQRLVFFFFLMNLFYV